MLPNERQPYVSLKRRRIRAASRNLAQAMDSKQASRGNVLWINDWS
uniref:Uncharacterized protein n=1 Tax=Rhizobium rhizogenes TaxID=359 RepID=A0A7S4ZUA8_RHIRH|nr:hypothetical protein pC6.5b_351 [Rhizobium rhizogenes]